MDINVHGSNVNRTNSVNSATTSMTFDCVQNKYYRNINRNLGKSCDQRRTDEFRTFAIVMPVYRPSVLRAPWPAAAVLHCAPTLWTVETPTIDISALLIEAVTLQDNITRTC